MERKREKDRENKNFLYIISYMLLSLTFEINVQGLQGLCKLIINDKF